MSEPGNGGRRRDGRTAEEPRAVRIETGVIDGTPGSVIYRVGDTQILCVATAESGVPSWRGDAGGWLTANYTLHPFATEPRGDGRPDGRSQEIRRLLGRSLRSSVDLTRIPGMTIRLDCEVLRADGGTRTASINGATIALGALVGTLLEDGRAAEDPRVETVLALSVGRLGGENLVDLDYSEDRHADIDLNVVATPAGDLVEVQGATESRPIGRAVWHELVDLATVGIGRIHAAIASELRPLGD